MYSTIGSVTSLAISESTALIALDPFHQDIIGVSKDPPSTEHVQVWFDPLVTVDEPEITGGLILPENVEIICIKHDRHNHLNEINP